MAVAATILQSEGNQARSAMMKLDMDDNTSFLTGTDIGATVASSLADGTAVDASAAIAYASTETLAPDALVNATVADLDSKLDGVRVYSTKNMVNEYVIHFVPIPEQAWNVTIGTPVFTPGA